MPISRKKACARCREAKARCTLTTPRCARCASRSLDCDYSTHTPRSSPYPGAGPGCSRINPVESFAIDADYLGMAPGPSPAEPGRLSSAGQLPFDLPSAQLSADACLPSLEMLPGHADTPATTAFLSFTQPLESVSQMLGFSSGANASPGPSSSNGISVDQCLLGPPAGRELGILKPLAKRRPLTPHAVFATKIMLGQVESYPRMMINGLTLPPFIHSRCSLEDGISETCSSKRMHQCLPKALSICSSLVQLFYTKTPQSSPFVWKTIYAEGARLYQEYETYDQEGLLEAAQSTCIYIILQTLDPDTIEINNVSSLIETIGHVAAKLNDVSRYKEDYSALNGRDFRYKWTFLESTRRTFSLLYVIETLLDVFIGNGDRSLCKGFAETPLPCPGRLWETASSTEWAEGYRQLVSARRRDRPLMIQDLWASCESLGLYPIKNNKDEEIVAQVLDWCGSLDQLGTMVWMAGTLGTATV